VKVSYDRELGPEGSAPLVEGARAVVQGLCGGDKAGGGDVYGYAGVPGGDAA
jgi:hypothetical protein